MTGRRMTPAEHFDEIEELGRHLWEALSAELRDRHQIDRQRLEEGTQCVCTCGARCPFWVTHLIDVRDHADYWARIEAVGRAPFRWLLGVDQVLASEICASCEHEYGRHLVGLNGCADCERWEPMSKACDGWERQLPEPKG